MQKHEKTYPNNLNLLVARLLKTKEVRKLLAGVVDEVLNSWGQDRFLKKRLAGILNNQLQKSLLKTKAAIDSESFKSFVEDAETKQLLKNFLSDWVIRTDFADMKESLDSSSHVFLDSLEAGNELLWKYPAKLVIVLSLLPLFADTGFKSLKLVLEGFNKAPPDLISDIFLSLLKDMEPAIIAETINQIMELLRKVDTGSHLIGDPGNPKLSREVNNFVDEVRSKIDGSLLSKNKLVLLKEKEILESYRLEFLYSKNENLVSQARFNLAQKNATLRKLRHHLSLLDDLTDQEILQLTKTISEEIDLQEVSESMEIIAGLLERLTNPVDNQIGSILTGLIRQLDPLVLQDIAGPLGTIFGQASIPVGRAIIPDLIIGLGKALSPRNDEFEKKASEARNALRSLLLEEEAST